MKKIIDPEEQEEDDDNSDSFDELDLEALIDEIFSEDDNQN